nr:probable histone acetyltransferase HAC-like 1 [Lolium perenne]
MDQVSGSDIGRADTRPLQHQQTHNVVGLAAEFDHEFRDYHNMKKEPSERHFLFALTILSAQHQLVEQTQQLLRHIASFGGYGTMTLTQGVTQGASENSRMPYVPYNMGPSIGANLVSQSTNMGTSQSGTYAHNEHVNTYLSLGMNPTHHSSRVSNNNYVIRMVDTSETNRISSMVSPPPPVTVEEVPNEPKFICPVCLHEIVDASSTICGHIFCKECIRASIKAQKKCPTCRTKLNLRNIHRVHLPTMD